MRMTPANILTLSRLMLTPVFLALFIAGVHGWAIAVFCLAGATDLIDGTVARWTRKLSEDGAMLDPIADKVLVQTCFISLAVIRILPLWFVLLAASRDITIVAGIFYLRSIKAKLPYRAIVLSKLATFAMIITAVLGLTMWYDRGIAFLGKPVDFWLGYVIIVTAALLVASGIRYVAMGFDIMRNHRLNRT